MRISHSLTFGLLLVLFLNGKSPDTNHIALDNCNSLEVSYTARKITPDKIEIVLRVQGGEEPYYYLFFDRRNKPLNWEFDRNSIEVSTNNIPHKMKVTDASGCLKVVQFNESEIK